MRILFAAVVVILIAHYTNSVRLGLAAGFALASIGEGLDRIYDAIKEKQS